jgi:serine/threonine protein kinase
MVGRTISHYRIQSKLGEGGMGVVYKALDLHLDRLVAIKVLLAEAVANPERQRRFVQEAKAASALRHPNIVHVYDIDTANGVDFIAMEYVEGKTLDELMGRKGLPVREALKYAVQIADALAAGTRVGHRSSRHQAGQHHGRRERLGEGPGFWPSQAHSAR